MDLEPTDDQACQEQLERCSEDLKEARRRLEEANDALRVLMKHRDSQTREIQHAVLTNVRNLLMPSLDKFRRSELDGEQKDLLCAIISQLDEITSPFLRSCLKIVLRAACQPSDHQMNHANPHDRGRSQRSMKILRSEGTMAILR